MSRRRSLLLLAGVAAVAIAVLRHLSRDVGLRNTPGGVLISDARLYDRFNRSLMGSFFAGVAEDVAARLPRGARVLEVGCGPGQLAIALTGRGLDVTGLDLDPLMIERARANAERELGGGDEPDFVVGDVAALPFADDTFDAVTSTLSMHHWLDPTAGLREISRVLRPGGVALIWDLRPGVVPFHRQVADPALTAANSGLDMLSATPWRWPWRIALSERLELAKA